MDYRARRAAFARGLQDGVAVIPAARRRYRNADTDYEFRQDSDFQYLTGFDEPDAVLVIAPHYEREREILFLHPRDRDQEIWTGRRLGVQAAPERLGIDAAYSLDELDARLPQYLCGARQLYYALGRHDRSDARIQTALESARTLTRRAGRAPESIVDPATILHEQRLRKDEREIAILRQAAATTALGFSAGMAATRAGMYEYQLEAAIEAEYFRNGAQSVAYPSIVASGVNSTILHYTANRKRLADGELVLVDSGCESDSYASDVTRTWPVNGKFSPEQRAVYEVVLTAQLAGISRVVPGAGCREFHDACVRAITEGLIDLGLLGGSLEENLEKRRYTDYFMHGSGHWLGLDVHDAGRYRDETDAYRALEPGMVTTVEPGIYVQQDLNCDERFKGIGVRIEDDVLVTCDGNENLTAAIPKTVAQLEALIGQRMVA